jgi:hypothetical protein
MRDEKNDNDTMLQVCCDVATLLQSCCDVATLLRRCCDVATLLRRCFDVATLLRRCCDVVGTVLTRIQRMSHIVATLLRRSGDSLDPNSEDEHDKFCGHVAENYILYRLRSLKQMCVCVCTYFYICLRDCACAPQIHSESNHTISPTVL